MTCGDVQKISEKLENVDLSGMPNLVSKFLTPKVLWHQNSLAVFLRIMLTDVENYHLELGDQTFKFSTILNDSKYFLSFKLCGVIAPEKTTHTNAGREVKICLIKAHKWVDWPRLTFSKEKNHFISADLEHFEKKQWDDPTASIFERESFSSYAKRMGLNVGPPPDSDGGSDGSDDEDAIGFD